MLKKATTLLITIIICLTASSSLLAQRERNFIYIFDASQSMKNPVNVWKPTKNWLYENMMQFNKGTATVVPFQDKAFPEHKFDLSLLKENEIDRLWVDLDEQLDKIVQKRAKHDLCVAWTEAMKRVDNKKNNYLYILTNSTDDVENMERLSDMIRDWGNTKAENVYVFYIMLSDNAYDEQLASTIDSCPNIFLIRAKNQKIDPFGVFAPHEITVNIQELRPRRLPFSIGGSYPLRAESLDSLLKVSATTIDHGYATFTVTPTDSAAIQKRLKGRNEYRFDVVLRTKDSKLNLLTDTLHVNVVNKPERVLYIQPHTPTLKAKVRHFHTLLFWKTNRPDTFLLNLNEFMNDEARNKNATATMRISADSLSTDQYQLFVNGKLCEDFTFVLDSSNRPTRIGIVFADDVPHDTYTFTMETASSEQLDRITDTAPEIYFLTLRARYETAWNPLVWIAVIVGALLFCYLAFRFFRWQKSKR